jgi:hypothetical protein
MPVTVNGSAVQWVLDTGANFSVLSESEARMLGMALAGGTGEIADSAGGAAAARMAVAQSVTIGGTELRDVSMLAFPDDRPPWNELEPGHRGIVGLPLALALDNIRWTSSGTCETGPRRSGSRLGKQPRHQRGDTCGANFLRRSSVVVHARHGKRKGDSVVAAICGGFSTGRSARNEV